MDDFEVRISFEVLQNGESFVKNTTVYEGMNRDAMLWVEEKFALFLLGMIQKAKAEYAGEVEELNAAAPQRKFAPA